MVSIMAMQSSLYKIGIRLFLLLLNWYTPNYASSFAIILVGMVLRIGQIAQ